MTRRTAVKSLWALLVIGVLGVAMGAQAWADSRLDFVLKNRLGVTIREVYVSPHDAEDWEEDVLGDRVLRDEGDVVINFDRSEDRDLWDLKVVTQSGKSYSWSNFRLRDIYEIKLYTRGGTAYASTK